MNYKSIVDEWAKKHRLDYDCYKEMIQELIITLEDKDNESS